MHHFAFRSCRLACRDIARVQRIHCSAAVMISHEAAASKVAQRCGVLTSGGKVSSPTGLPSYNGTPGPNGPSRCAAHRLSIGAKRSKVPRPSSGHLLKQQCRWVKTARYRHHENRRIEAPGRLSRCATQRTRCPPHARASRRHIQPGNWGHSPA